ncbi:hypothetical protein [Janthinobacterium sp. LB2P10]|uniref:hypothetical protein n=1 Tax=Janthinobacterium sp. LB2P10 TaxID=3424194 RepID=UPI003F2354BD
MDPSKEIDIITRAAAAFERVGNASVARELRSLHAAAPQVVEDEQAAFESYITDNGAWLRAAERSADGKYRLMATAVAWNTWRAATDSFAARAAVPMQVQELVAGKPCPYCGSTDGAHDKAYPHPRVPVQPVAVPDPLYQAMHDFRDDVLSGIDGLDNDQINAVLGTFDNYMLDEPAAPAAQGDAKDGIIRDLNSIGMKFAAALVALPTLTSKNIDWIDRENVMREVNDWRTEWDKVSARRAAIAAKAAS